MAHNTNSYRLLVTLRGQHGDTIACIQFSPCGGYLVTGGDDLRMNVFDCANNFRNILSISSTSAASAICWNPDKPRSCFVGYSSGAIVSHTFGSDQEEWAAEILLFNGHCRVVALAWDKILAVATERNVFLINDIKAGADGQRGVVDTQRSAITISPPATNHGQPEPRSVCFTPDGFLVIAYLEHGVVCWSLDGRTLRWSFTPRALRMYANDRPRSRLLHNKLTFIRNSGRFSYSPKLDRFVLHNLYDGFDAYTMKSRTHFRSYRFPVSEECNVPLSCVLINEGRHIVCGTTSGKAVVLDAITLAHQADLLHCQTGLVQDIAHCNKNGVNVLATTASEKGSETTVKIWTADFISCQSIGYADRITEAFRGAIDLLSDLVIRIIRWRGQTVQISVISLILWASVLPIAVIVALHFNANILERFGLSLRSTCRSSWAASKNAFLKNGRILWKALRFSVRACYLFLKGAAIALYEFLEEEQPYPPVNTIRSTITESGAARDSLKFQDVFEKRGAETVQENGLAIDDLSGVLGSHSLSERVAIPVQADKIVDLAISAGFSRVETEIPAMSATPTINDTPGADNTPMVGGGDDSSNCLDRGVTAEQVHDWVTTDIQVYGGVTTDIQVHTDGIL